MAGWGVIRQNRQRAGGMRLRRKRATKWGFAAAAIALPALLAGSGGGRRAWAQELTGSSVSDSMQTLPDAPGLAIQQQAPQEPVPPQTDSSSQTSPGAQQPVAQPQSERAKAKQQIKQQETQRVLGILPMFNTSYVSDAVSLTAGEKIRLAFRTAIDPVSFAGPAVVAGIGELNAPPNNNGFGWGAEGYFKKWGAAYVDAFDGTMIGNGLLPALLRQDPRYFRMGHGSTAKRLLYAVSTSVICKHDKTGKWEPNYSNVGGNLAAGALSNLYYPSGTGLERGGWEQTFTSAMIVTATGTVGSALQEFWPDISRKLFKKDPTHGLDDKARTAQPANGAAQSDKPKQPLMPAPK